jgi:hypothetical protein
MALSNRVGGDRVEFQPMSPEDIERTMQFLLNQQAQFAVDFVRLSEKTDRIAEGLIGLTGIVGRVAHTVDGLAAKQDRTDEQLRALATHLQETDTGLSDHIRTVETHLNVVIEMFERHLRENHGPKPS